LSIVDTAPMVPYMPPVASVVPEVEISQGESHTFDLPLTSARVWSPEPLDVIEIDSILWEDGTHNGTHGGITLGFGIAADGGRRLQPQRALQVLHMAEHNRGNTTALLSVLRQGFTALPESDETRLEAARQSMRAMRTTILRDLDGFERSLPRDAAAVRAWIQITIDKYDDWLKRLAA
jgi:hypothetical protein